MSGPDLERDEDGLVRLHKLLARSGVASRRKCEELMLAGEVTVDGEVVTRLGTKVDPAAAVIRVSGKRLPPISEKVYLVLNKPRGVVSTMSDPEGRRTLQDLVADRPERLFHVGRLDTDTSGLIILTNDGDFAHRLAHPSYEVDKTYVAEVTGQLFPRVVKQLLGGVITYLWRAHFLLQLDDVLVEDSDSASRGGVNDRIEPHGRVGTFLLPFDQSDIPVAEVVKMSDAKIRGRPVI